MQLGHISAGVFQHLQDGGNLPTILSLRCLIDQQLELINRHENQLTWGSHASSEIHFRAAMLILGSRCIFLLEISGILQFVRSHFLNHTQ
jgi:hypothetical protein